MTALNYVQLPQVLETTVPVEEKTTKTERTAVIPVVGATVTIAIRAGAKGAASIYSARTGGAPLSGVVTNSKGAIGPSSGTPYYVQEGSYTITFSGGTPSVASTSIDFDAVSGSGVDYIGVEAIKAEHIEANTITNEKLANSLKNEINISRGTSLPGSPKDGEEYDYVASSTAGVIWRFRYRAASSSSYKWEFVGGSKLQTTFAGDITTESSSGVALTGGPSIVIPLSGNYSLDLSISTVGGGVNTIAIAQIYQNSTATSASLEHTITTSDQSLHRGQSVVDEILTGETLTVKVSNANSSSTRFVSAIISAIPIRV